RGRRDRARAASDLHSLNRYDFWCVPYCSQGARRGRLCSPLTGSAMRTLSLLPVAALIPLSLFAQDSTAKPRTPFRRGQWATQFTVGSTFGSLGFLKFRSPTRALVLDVLLSGFHSENSVDDSAGDATVVASQRLLLTTRSGSWPASITAPGARAAAHLRPTVGRGGCLVISVRPTW